MNELAKAVTMFGLRVRWSEADVERVYQEDYAGICVRGSEQGISPEEVRVVLLEKALFRDSRVIDIDDLVGYPKERKDGPCVECPDCLGEGFYLVGPMEKKCPDCRDFPRKGCMAIECIHCGGGKMLHSDEPFGCKWCKGRGTVLVPCDKCQGTGAVTLTGYENIVECGRCGGTGRIRTLRSTVSVMEVGNANEAHNVEGFM